MTVPWLDVDGWCIESDGPELIDIERAAVNAVPSVHHAKATDTSAQHVTSGSLQAQHGKPGSHDDDDVDDATVNHHGANAVVHTNDGNLATVRNGNELFVLFPSVTLDSMLLIG